MNKNSNTYKEPNRVAGLIAEVHGEIYEELDHYLPSNLYLSLGLTKDQMEGIVKTIFSYVFEDLSALANRDPAAKNKAKYVFETYLSFKAVMYYRIANVLNYCKDITNQELREKLARSISEDAKIRTLVEINPSARIGRRFVIDHGVKTVIGETCKIGDDCYILNGVILGSPDISDNTSENRHPTLGNDVQIGAFARIFGPVTIGDHVIINPHCVITMDIPSNTEVVIVNQLQLTTSHVPKKIEIYGIVPEGNGGLSVYGCNFTDELSISLVDGNHEEIDGLEISRISKETDCINAKLLLPKKNIVKEKLQKLGIKISQREDTIIITESLGLKKEIYDLINGET